MRFLIYLSKRTKACFQHGIAYGDFKDLTRKTTSAKTLPDKKFYVAKNPKYYGLLILTYLNGL